MLLRMRCSRAIHSFKHSRHLRYALKNGVGVLLLSLPAFLRYGSQGQHSLVNCICLGLQLHDTLGNRWFSKYHGQWVRVRVWAEFWLHLLTDNSQIVVTYIFVLETNTGATIRVGGLRLLGTFLGALMASLVRVSADL